jgi:16S rRNA (guanine966-N2)-methyltransferase
MQRRNAAVRIVAGRHRGRHLQAPDGLAVRPTGERAREALFDVLASGRLTGGRNTFSDAWVLDGFAGSGALGLEAVSRGAAHVVFMENYPAALAAIEANVSSLGEEDRTTVLRADVLRPPPSASGPEARPCALALLDPPYNQGLAAPALTALAPAGWLAEGALCVVELMAGEPFDAPADFVQVEVRKYGKALLVFLNWQP